MKKFIAFILGVVISTSVLPMQLFAEEFVNEMIVAPQYDDAKTFSEGLAAVKVGNNWGYIDDKNNMVIPAKYDYASTFNEGKAIVAIGGKFVGEGYQRYQEQEFGFVDKKGNFTPFKDENNADFIHNNFDVSKEGRDSPEYDEHKDYVFHNGVAVLTGWFWDGEMSGLFDTSGNSIKIKYPKNEEEMFIIQGSLNEGLIPVLKGFGDQPEYFYIDKNGNVVLKFPSYHSSKNKNGKFTTDIRPFNQGLAPARQTEWKDGGVVNELWGFINKSGKFVIQPQYENFMVRGLQKNYEVFNDGVASVKQNGNWGGININGKKVIDFKYDNVGIFSEGLLGAKEHNNTFYKYINTKGQSVINGNFNIVSPFNDGVAAVYSQDIDKTYCIKQTPNTGQDNSYDIKGTANLSKDVYFPDGEEGMIQSPSEYITIKENGKYGFKKFIVDIGLPSKDSMDGWAYDEVVESINAKLVPKSLQNQYRSDIIRSDFATLIVKALEEISGQEIGEIVKSKTGKTIDDYLLTYPFTDTVDRDVIAANALGIITGVGNNKFESYSNIKRQDAATLILRAAKVLGAKVENNDDVKFKDQDKIASYALEGVQYVASLDIMNGTGGDKFSPTSEYTRQQAYITVYRLLKNMLDK